MFKTIHFDRRSLLKGSAAAAAGLSSFGPTRFADLALAAESGERINVRVANTAGNMTLVLQTLLEERGILREFGLAPEFVNVSDGSKINSALLGGDVDVCMVSGFSSLLPAIEKGAKLKVLCGAGTLVGQCLYSKKPDVRELKDLVGKTVGIGAIGALLHEITVAMMRKHGVDEKKVNFVNVGSSTDVFRAVVAGTIDAGSAEIDNSASVDKFGIHVLTNGKAWEQIPEYTWQAGYASDTAIATKRDALVRTLASFGKLYRFITGPGSFEAYSLARATALSAQKNDGAEAKLFWDFLQKYRGYAHNLILTQEQIDVVQDLNISLGVQQKRVSFDQVADMSIARDALKLMG